MLSPRAISKMGMKVRRNPVDLVRPHSVDKFELNHLIISRV